MTTSPLKKIALIEDGPDTLELFRHFLNRLCDDFEVCPFPTGPAFLEVFQRGAYRLVILDISLPRLDGYEVVRRLRKIDPAVPVIAFTAHAGPSLRQNAMQAGFNDVITKPVHDMSAFCQTVINLAEASAA
jgi:two-component system nitrogen regulation response regulator NtrX